MSSGFAGDDVRQARVAALSLAHGAALAKLLRAHGRVSHAENLEAALDAFLAIISEALGPDVVTQALDWASDEAWGCRSDSTALVPRH